MSGSISSKKIEAVAIGAFDGMHVGHQELFKRLGPKGAVVVIEKGTASLTPGKERCRYVQYPCIFFELSQIKELDAAGFLALLKKRFPNLKKIVVGYDFAFGKDRRYSIADLRKWFDGEVEVVDEVKVDGIAVHSRVIKELIQNGEIEKANRLLGRPYCIEGVVVPGQGIAKKELLPTLNLVVSNFLLPKEGVYATETIIDGKRYSSVTFIGKRVTTDGRFALETHLIDTELAHTPENIEICFKAYLRQNRKFDSLQELKLQIQKDIERARKIVEF